MAKYRAIFEVPEHNYYMDGTVLESTDFRRIWHEAYSYAREFMSEMEGEDSTMFVYFKKEVPSLSGQADSFWAYITMISAWVHLDRLADLDRITGFKHNNSDLYAIRRREA